MSAGCGELICPSESAGLSQTIRVKTSESGQPIRVRSAHPSQPIWIRRTWLFASESLASAERAATAASARLGKSAYTRSESFLGLSESLPGHPSRLSPFQVAGATRRSDSDSTAQGARLFSNDADRGPAAQAPPPPAPAAAASRRFGHYLTITGRPASRTAS